MWRVGWFTFRQVCGRRASQLAVTLAGSCLGGAAWLHQLWSSGLTRLHRLWEGLHPLSGAALEDGNPPHYLTLEDAAA